MNEAKFNFKGHLGTKFRLILNGPHAGDIVETYAVLKAVTNGFKRAVEERVAREELEKELGREPTKDEVAERMKTKPADPPKEESKPADPPAQKEGAP